MRDDLLETCDGAVAILGMNDPARRNAPGLPLRPARRDRLQALGQDPGYRPFPLTGAGGELAAVDVSVFGAGMAPAAFRARRPQVFSER